MFLMGRIMKMNMNRNLDMNALRSFVAVAEEGGVTRAAGIVNLTQSAVSMQIKRLETMLDIELFERRNRTLVLTPNGEQLLSFARRILALNDEAWLRLTHDTFEGELTLGVPHDIVYPAIPTVLRECAKAFPRVKINLVSSYTEALHAAFVHGDCDIILTTEQTLRKGGETLVALPLVFVGAPDGNAWRERPLRLAFEDRCIFRPTVQRLLDKAGVAWELAVTSDNTRTIEASVSADLAVHAMLAGTARENLEMVAHNGDLPELGSQQINIYRPAEQLSPAADGLVGIIRSAFANLQSGMDAAA